MTFLTRLLAPFRPQPMCPVCAEERYNECAEARRIMEMDPRTPWTTPIESERAR